MFEHIDFKLFKHNENLYYCQTVIGILGLIPKNKGVS